MSNGIVLLNPILNFALLEIESKNNQTLLYNGVPTKVTYIPRLRF